jgi:hypothetical protein
MLDQRADDLGQILDRMAANLEIPAEDDEALRAAYDDIAEWLKGRHESKSVSTAWIYPQGSRRLRTMVRPVDPNGHHDVDLVFELHRHKETISKEELRSYVGGELEAYTERLRELRRFVPELKPGSRCWTLNYERFHLDILPAVSAIPESEDSSKIDITDRSLRFWQSSDPLAFARWFASRSALSPIQKALRSDKLAEVHVEGVPGAGPLTPLHRGVQLLKRHRDLWVAETGEHCIASVIITTIAAMLYDGVNHPYAILRSFSRDAEGAIKRRGADLWLPNPVCEDENFADRWNSHPERFVAFQRWLASLAALMGTVYETRGHDKIAAVLSKSFGSLPTENALREIARASQRASADGRLAISQQGRLVTNGSGHPVPRHTFYGTKTKP